MKLRYRITLGILGVLAGSLAVLALLLGHESACEPAPDLAEDAQTMKAYMHRCYGSPDVLTLEDVAKPEPVLRWQSRQWQWFAPRTVDRSIVYVTAPQTQPPFASVSLMRSSYGLRG